MSQDKTVDTHISNFWWPRIFGLQYCEAKTVTAVRAAWTLAWSLRRGLYRHIIEKSFKRHHLQNRAHPSPHFSSFPFIYSLRLSVNLQSQSDKKSKTISQTKHPCWFDKTVDISKTFRIFKMLTKSCRGKLFKPSTKPFKFLIKHFFWQDILLLIFRLNGRRQKYFVFLFWPAL